MELFTEDTFKIFLSLLFGSLIGLEREYRSKAAGFRTITLISIGSTLFTIVSIKLGGASNADRIAANIITGIGFIGAGVIFKEGLSISGLTTSTTIWATAALGMEIGAGDYMTAFEGLLVILVVLSLFEYVQTWIDNFHQKKFYKIVFIKSEMDSSDLEKELIKLKLSFAKRKEIRFDNEIVCYYDVYGSKKKHDVFNTFLLNYSSLKSFEY
ncbi:MAG: MgtC/SapB family protein [Bacteroidia bacterium]